MATSRPPSAGGLQCGCREGAPKNTSPRRQRFRLLAFLVLLPTLCLSLRASAAYLPDAGGLVAFEAEHFSGKVARAGYDWQREANPKSGFSGEPLLGPRPRTQT